MCLLFWAGGGPQSIGPDTMFTDGSLDLLRMLFEGLDMWAVAPAGRGERVKEGYMSADDDTLGAAFTALTAGLSDEQKAKLRNIMLAHVTFLIGALDLATGEPQEG